MMMTLSVIRSKQKETGLGSNLRRVGNEASRHDARRYPLRLLVVVLLLSVAAQANTAQTTDAESLAKRSAIIVRGTVVKTSASEEPLLAASTKTVVISVRQMYAGSEIAGDQTGKIATVILSREESVKTGEEALFFGNPRYVGRSLTIADEGEISSKPLGATTVSAIEVGVQARKDLPVLESLAKAGLVFRGSVESVQPIETSVDRGRSSRELRSEHDPEWQIAAVRVIAPMRGGQSGALVTLVFASSLDIMWFNAPKLKVGEDAIFIAHAPDSAAYGAFALGAFLKKEAVFMVTEPSDVLPAKDDKRVRDLIAKETRQ